MLIKVKTLTGKEIELDIEPNDKVERIKEKAGFALFIELTGSESAPRSPVMSELSGGGEGGHPAAAAATHFCREANERRKNSTGLQGKLLLNLDGWIAYLHGRCSSRRVGVRLSEALLWPGRALSLPLHRARPSGATSCRTLVLSLNLIFKPVVERPLSLTVADWISAIGGLVQRGLECPVDGCTSPRRVTTLIPLHRFTPSIFPYIFAYKQGCGAQCALHMRSSVRMLALSNH